MESIQEQLDPSLQAVAGCIHIPRNSAVLEEATSLHDRGKSCAQPQQHKSDLKVEKGAAQSKDDFRKSENI